MPLPLHPDPIPLSSKDVNSFVFDDPTYDINKPVLIDPDNPQQNYFSHSRAKQVVKRLIAGFLASGLHPRETVCIHGFNSIWYPLFVLGVIGAGGVCVGTNPGYTAVELRHALKVARVKYVLAEPGAMLDNIVQAMRVIGLDVVTRLWVLDFDGDSTDVRWMDDGTGRGMEYEGLVEHLPSLLSSLPTSSTSSPSMTKTDTNRFRLQSWRSLVRHGAKDWIRFDDQKTSEDTIAQLYYTSGTTGLPKCAMTSHYNLVAQHQIYFEANPKSYPYKVILCMPTFHIGGSGQYIISSLKQGRDAYVMRRFELEPFLRHNNKYQCTEVFLVPPMINAIVMSGFADPNASSYKPAYNMKSVRNGITGAAPCSANLQARFASLLGDNATFTQIWGMTETTSMATMVPMDLAQQSTKGGPKIWGSVGKPLSHISIKLIDEQGQDVTTTLKRGQICVKGPTVVKGYFENELATKQSFDSEGYFLTGDIATISDDGYEMLYIVERLKELIKVRGFQCAPAELEGALTEHPDIIDAAVIGVRVSFSSSSVSSGKVLADGKIQSGGDEEEAPKAFIVKRPGSKLTEDVVHAHMKNRVARYKQLTGGVVFVDDIPKLPSGKILKRILREREELERRRTLRDRGSKL